MSAFHPSRTLGGAAVCKRSVLRVKVNLHSVVAEVAPEPAFVSCFNQDFSPRLPNPYCLNVDLRPVFAGNGWQKLISADDRLRRLDLTVSEVERRAMLYVEAGYLNKSWLRTLPMRRAGSEIGGTNPNDERTRHPESDRPRNVGRFAQSPAPLPG